MHLDALGFYSRVLMSINGFIVYRDNKFWIEVVDMCP
jgi:hypothetical protein